MKMTKNAAGSKPMVTNWVTAPNLTGIGTANVQSALMVQYLASLPEYYDLFIEVNATLQRTAGTGNARVVVALAGYGENLVTSINSPATLKYTTMQEAAATARTRKWIIKPSVLQSVGTTLAEKIDVFIYGSGSSADTEFAISDIKFRLIYFPL